MKLWQILTFDTNLPASCLYSEYVWEHKHLTNSTKLNDLLPSPLPAKGVRSWLRLQLWSVLIKWFSQTVLKCTVKLRHFDHLKIKTNSHLKNIFKKCQSFFLCVFCTQCHLETDHLWDCSKVILNTTFEQSQRWSYYRNFTVFAVSVGLYLFTDFQNLNLPVWIQADFLLAFQLMKTWLSGL